MKVAIHNHLPRHKARDQNLRQELESLSGNELHQMAIAYGINTETSRAEMIRAIERKKTQSKTAEDFATERGYVARMSTGGASPMFIRKERADAWLAEQIAEAQRRGKSATGQVRMESADPNKWGDRAYDAEYQYWAEGLKTSGGFGKARSKKLGMVGPFSSREEAEAAAKAKFPEANEVQSGYGSGGIYADIRWRRVGS